MSTYFLDRFHVYIMYTEMVTYSVVLERIPATRAEQLPVR